MDNNNGQQPIQPDMPDNNMQQSLQPDMSDNNMQQPLQPGMGMNMQQPIQPDMGMNMQQPMQPGMGMNMQQPLQPDMGMNMQQPIQPDMGMNMQQPLQPGMGMNMQQPMQSGMSGYYGQTPYGMPTDVSTKKQKKPKKPMTKGKLAALISGGVAIVAAVVCGVIFLPKIFKSDKEVVLDAIGETFASYGEQSVNTKEEILGYSEIQKRYREDGGNTDIAFTLSAGEGADAYSIHADMNHATDFKNNQISSIGTVSVGDTELLSYDLFMDEENTYIALPDMINGYMVYPTDNPLEALADSTVGKYLEMGDASQYSGMTFNVFPEEGESQLASGYVDAFETIWDAAEFEKQGKAKISVNGETVTAKEYYVTWTKEDLQDACISAIDGMTEMVLESESTLEESGISAEDYETQMEQIKALVPSIINDDLQIKVYVKDKRAVKITCKDSVSILGMVNFDYDFWLDAGDNDISGNLLFDAGESDLGVKFEAHDMNEDCYGTVTLFSNEDEFVIDFSKEVEEASDSTVSKTKISAESYFSLEWEKDYNKADNSFGGTITASIMESDAYVVEYSGAFTDIKKGVSYSTAIDSFEVKAAGETICTGSYKETLDTSNPEVVAKDESLNQYEIVSMTEEDFEQFGAESEALMEAWMERLQESEECQNFVEAVNSLSNHLNLTDDTYDDIDWEDDDWDDEAEEDDWDDEWDDDSYQEMTLEDAYLETWDGNHKYMFNGCIDGFAFTSASGGLNVSFYTEELSSIYYGISSDYSSMEDVLQNTFYSYEDSYDVQESSLMQSAVVDGSEVLYSYERYSAFGMNCLNLTAVKPLQDDVYMYITADIYLDDDDYTVEDILQALSSEYVYEVK